VKSFLRRHPRLRTEHLPAYAPELKPVEAVWSHAKLNPLANYAPPDADDLADVAHRHVSRLRHQPRLLHSFIRQTGLSL